ncbi:MAG: AMP-binding protein, partial [Fimbriimonadaceae bacterium]|nr:AMP-binding protein [Alphaproteobacteria bacterium]
LNCVPRFIDYWIEKGEGDRPAFLSPFGNWTFADLYKKVNQLAHVLVDDLGLVPGNRVLLRSANNPMMVAAYMAVIRAGGITVGTMPLLRSRELAVILNKAEISHALCDVRLRDEMDLAGKDCRFLKHLRYFDASSANELEGMMATKPGEFEPYPSRADDVCLIAFTSGTTGAPKGTMHFQRDMLTICDGFSSMILKPNKDDIFCGTPPLAFTFGLGGMSLFSMHVGASTLLMEAATPEQQLQAIQKYKTTILFTAPTAYRAMMQHIHDYDFSSMRRCVSAGEHLPKSTYEAFLDVTGIKLIDGLGSTEMLHVFITSADDDVRAGATGIVVPGYHAKIVDDAGKDVPPGTIGRLAVYGPTGCRYLADERQKVYVQDGWNMTGDAYLMDEDGYFWFQARADDMIISAGYNISGPEIENALLEHQAVGECAVVGKPDENRGSIVKAFIVLNLGANGNDQLVKELQDYVKRSIAPYKYPREIAFVEKLPKTETGKLQRYKLRELG